MTKNDAINIIAKKSNSSITDVARIINEYQNIIMEVVASGDSVNFVGFGSYEPLSKKSREARNPQTGEKIHVEETVVPKFKPGKAFRDKVSTAYKFKI